MYKILSARDINPEQWDHFIDSSEQGNIYARFWYLSALSPNWKAIQFTEDDRLIAVMPFLPERKFFYTQINTPFAIQQLGVYTVDGKSPNPDDLKQILFRWLKTNAFVSYRFNIGNNLLLAPLTESLPIYQQVTHHLHLLPPYQVLYEKFSSNQKRNIRKAGKNGIKTRTEGELEKLIILFRQSRKGLPPIYANQHYNDFRTIYQLGESRKACRIYTARNEQGEIIAGGLFLFLAREIVYIFGASAEEGRQSGAMSAVFDHLIRDYAGQDRVLDFEGSQVPSLARFYKSFGGEERTFFHLFDDKRTYIRKIKKMLSHVYTRR